jgi:hypothetical protein
VTDRALDQAGSGTGPAGSGTGPVGSAANHHGACHLTFTGYL